MLETYRKQIAQKLYAFDIRDTEDGYTPRHLFFCGESEIYAYLERADWHIAEIEKAKKEGYCNCCKEITAQSTTRACAPKGKYVMLLGIDKREQKKINTKKYWKSYPYPKR